MYKIQKPIKRPVINNGSGTKRTKKKKVLTKTEKNKKK